MGREGGGHVKPGPSVHWLQLVSPPITSTHQITIHQAGPTLLLASLHHQSERVLTVDLVKKLNYSKVWRRNVTFVHVLRTV